MKENWGKAIEFVLKWEGGETVDTGGYTKYGISKKRFPELDIENLTLEEAKDIYYREYWLKYGCDKLPYPIDIIMFNCSVQAETVAKKILDNHENWQDFLLQMIRYYTYLAGSRKYRPYFRGWINRTIDLYNMIKRGA